MRSSICGECATDYIRNAVSITDSCQGFDQMSLGHIVATIDTDDAREVYAGWRALADAHFAKSPELADIQRARYEAVQERRRAQNDTWMAERFKDAPKG